MDRRPPHLLPGQSDARQAQLLAESPLESWHQEVANGGVFSADKLATLFLVLGLFFSQLGLIGTPAALAATDTYRDEFAAIAFTGSDGTIDWSVAPWAEGGESDGPGDGTPGGGGQLAVVSDNDCGAGNNCLEIRADSSSVFTLTRQVDLSSATAATLTFDYLRRQISVPNGAAITLEISDDGGSGWDPLAIYIILGTDAGFAPQSIDLSGYSSPNALLRFRTDGSNRQAALYVDNFQVEVTTPDPNVVLVNSTGDADDNNPGDHVCDTGGTNSKGATECTLQAAMREAEASGTVDTIHFKMPPTESGHSAGVWTITPTSALPLMLTTMTIDAATQTGWAGDPIVAIDGSSAGAGADGFYVGAANSEIRGFVIHSFLSDGTVLDSAPGSTIAGNWIGLLPDGSTPAGNGNKGIIVGSGATGVTVGGSVNADRNVVSANTSDGIQVTADGATIENNYIGTDATGALARGNGDSGMEINGAASTTIVDNLVSGNTNYGIDMRAVGSTLNSVRGNFIGTDIAGTGDLGNGTDGVAIRNGANSNTIGGTNPADRNIISGNDNDGIWITDAGTESNTVLGNWIGVASDGSALPNLYHGVAVEFGAANNLVGGTTTEAANRIENNAWDGVAFGGAGTGNTALGNSISGNTGLGIDHGNDGVTPNGAGNPLDFPTITSATESGGTVTVDFALTNTPDGDYRIEFFDNAAADVSGNGEGETWVGAVNVTVTGGVPSPASTTFAGSVGDILTATATEGTSAPFGSTSEFSAAYTVTPGGPNNPPTAVIVGGPYSIVEGGQLDLDGSGSSDPDTDPLTYRWDLDNDGQFDDETGVTPSVPWAALAGLGLDDDGGPFTIGLEVDDGTDTDTTSTTLTITNTAPTVTVTGSGSATAGSPYTVNLSVTDPGDDGVLEWDIDWGDGTRTNIVGNPATAAHPYTTPGYHEIRAAVTDEDGTFNATTVIVPQYDGDTVLEISSLTGDVVRTFSDAALDAPVDAAVASDGYLYVVGNQSQNVVRFDSGTGAFESNFVPSGTGGLAGPGWLIFPSEAELWVSTFGPHSIKAFARSGGGYLGEPVPTGVGGLTSPTEMTIGPNGDLFVASWATDSIHRYDAETGLFLGLFVSSNLNNPTDLAFGPDGNLYVTNFLDDAVRRFNGTTGAYEADVVSLTEAYGITFGPDGLMYVTSQGLHQFNVYDLSGTLLGQLSNSGDGLSGPSSFDFVPSHYVTVGPADSDGDGLWDHQEDDNADGDNDPSTNPGPNTDGDANPNYLDFDDDGDGTATASENADPNGDGDSRDALDGDRDAEPDYLDSPTAAASGSVDHEQVISETLGGLAPALGVSDHFGRAVAPIGDLDGDGVNDIAVGAPNDDDGSSDRGAVYILFMNGNGTVKGQQKISDTDGGFTATLDNADEFGISATGLGDLDGDGINDIAVGALNDDDGGTALGAAYVLFLNSDGTVKAEQKISSTEGGFVGPISGFGQFGRSVAGLGDVDDDGNADLAVGAWVSNAVYVLFLNSDGTVKGEQKISGTEGGFVGPLGGSDRFGVAVAGLGDLGGDGPIDIVVGAYLDDDGGSERGAVYVLNLTTGCADSDGDGLCDLEEDANTDADNDPSTNPGPNTDGDANPNYLDADDDGDGTPTASENADPNGDGDPRDAIDSDRDGQPDYLDAPIGVSSGLVSTEAKISDLVGALGAALDDSDFFGADVTGIGDLDGDGINDIAVGSVQDDDGGLDRGAVYVLF
ncbi:MAG: PKD domain-containing protein, partial [Acidimicrobiia bacterium]|nr:PKD domain-containing protein [Acidimicrobiia bacterium]